VPQKGLWYDGQIALERPVALVPEPPWLVLIDDAGKRHPVAIADLVRLDTAAGRLTFAHRSSEGWRLLIEEPLEPSVLGHLPVRSGSLTAGPGRRTMSVLFGLTALVSAMAGLVIFAPEAVAKRMPMSWERTLGAVYELPIAATRCENPNTRAALDTMIDRIDPEARSDGLTLELVQFEMANAVALPGGRMVLFSGLFEEIDDADAIAGIVAHEIAHVRRRHVAAAVVRELGLGTVVTLLGGGTVAANAGNVLSLNFSRRAEAEADTDAIAMLKQAGIDPRPIAEMFEQAAKGEADHAVSSMELLSSHPVSSGRARRFRDSFDPAASYRPSLGPEHDAALFEGCQATG